MSTESIQIRDEKTRHEIRVAADLALAVRETLASPNGRRFWTWLLEIQCMPDAQPERSADGRAWLDGRQSLARDLVRAATEFPELAMALEQDRAAFRIEEIRHKALLRKHAEERPGAAPPEPKE